MDDTPVRISHPAALLAMLPRLIGFDADAGIVLIPFSGTRTSRALRVDLPPAGADPCEVADALVRIIAALPGVTTLVVVVLLPRGAARDEGAASAEGAGPADDAGPVEFEVRAIAAAIAGTARAHDITTSDVLVRTPEAWRSLLSGATGSATEIDRARASLGAVTHAPSAREARALTPPSPREVQRMVDARRAAARCSDAALGDRIAAWPGLLGTPAALSDIAGYAIVALARGALRGAVRQGLTVGDTGFDVHEAAARFGGLGHEPPPDLLAKIAVLERMAHCATPDLLPHVLALLAWTHWARGSGTVAHHFAAWSASIDDGADAGACMAALFARVPLPEWLLSDAHRGGRAVGTR